MPPNFVDQNTIITASLPKVNLRPIVGLSTNNLQDVEVNAMIQATNDLRTVVLRQTSIMSFGADPSGASDCSAALAAAIASLSTGGVLHFPVGVYRLSANVTSPVGVTLDFDSSYLSIDNAVTLTVNGEIRAPQRARIFSFASSPSAPPVIISFGKRSVGWFGTAANGSTDDTAAIQQAISSIPQGLLNTANHAPCSLQFPSAPVGYKISSSLTFVNVFNLQIEFEAPVYAEQAGGNAWLRHQLQWYGNTTSAVVQFSGAAMGIRIDNMSINGKASTYAALFGLAFDLVGPVGNDPAKCVITNHLHVSQCRFGLSIGGDSAQLDDATQHVHNQYWGELNTDSGCVVNSGNIGAIQFNAPLLSSNGQSPTTDSYNPAGLGTNFNLIAGQVSLFEGVSVGTPATCGIFDGQDMNISGWWAEDLAPALQISATPYTRHTSIAGFRHYSGSMTDTTVPNSVISNAKGATFTSCFFFGNVQLNSGQGGNAVASGTNFYSGTQRPTLGQGGFTGSLVTTYRGLISLGDRGNNTGMIIGGGGTRAMGPTTQIGPVSYTSVGQGLGEALGPNAGDSGYCFGPPNVEDVLGSFEICVNCYPIPGTGTYLAYRVGQGTRYTISNSGVIAVEQYTFSDTTTPILYSSWVSVNQVTYSATAPTDGTPYPRSAIQYNTAAAPGGYVGWTFTTGGVVSGTVWQATHAYAAAAVTNNGGNVYQATAPGTSAGSGGPTGTGSTITDGTVVWKYVGPLAVYKTFGAISP